MVLEKTLESPLDCEEIQPVHSEDQSWVFFGKNDAKAETPVLWPPHASCVIVSVALSIQSNFKVEWHNEKLVSDEFCCGKICVRVDRGNSVFVFYFWKLICLYSFH